MSVSIHPRRDRIDLNVRGELNGHRLGRLDDRSFRCTVRRNEFRSKERVRTANVNGEGNPIRLVTQTESFGGWRPTHLMGSRVLKLYNPEVIQEVIQPVVTQLELRNLPEFLRVIIPAFLAHPNL
jgi:hypothetical protein